MQHLNTPGKLIKTTVGIATLIAAVVLPVALSYEILRGESSHLAPWYLNVQLAVCAVFLLDFSVRITADKNRWRFLRRNILFLLLSVPYLNIVDWLEIEQPRGWSIFMTTIPILRMLLALYLLVVWIIKDGLRQLFTAYALTLLLFTYIAALVFYDFEFGRNSGLTGFGDAIWWAFMNMTTVGSSITPITAIGKILAVLLPLFGMLMLPLFTVYISNIFQKEQKERDSTIR